MWNYCNFRQTHEHHEQLQDESMLSGELDETGKSVVGLFSVWLFGEVTEVQPSKGFFIKPVSTKPK